MAEAPPRLSLGVLDAAMEETEFKVLRTLGSGAYGSVYECDWRSNDCKVALKVFKRSVNGEKGISATALREVSILNKLRGDRRKELVTLLHTFTRAKCDTLVCVYEACECDLADILKRKALDWAQKRRVMADVMRGVCFLHSKKIAHRDLKPQNILMTANGRAKIADFGLARGFSVRGQTWTRQVQTLWYRAPELLFGIKDYMFEVDVWSMGAVFGEIISGEALFSANSEVGAIMKIMQVKGTPTHDSWPECFKLPNFSAVFPKFKAKCLFAVLKLDADNSEAERIVTLLQNMLCLNPVMRWPSKVIHDFNLFADVD